MKCEHCLQATDQDACPTHPHATLLDPERPADQQWLAVLGQRHAQRRWQRGAVAVVLATAALGLLWTPLLGLVVMVGIVAVAVRPTAPVLLATDTLLSADHTPRAARPRRTERSSGRRPAPGRVTMAG